MLKCFWGIASSNFWVHRLQRFLFIYLALEGAYKEKEKKNEAKQSAPFRVGSHSHCHGFDRMWRPLPRSRAPAGAGGGGCQARGRRGVAAPRRC